MVPLPHPSSSNLGAFNTDGIVFDNSPWRPGRDMDLVDHPVSEDDERKLKNLATRIMSNGVEVLVKDKSSDQGKQEQRMIKVMHHTSMKPTYHKSSSPMPKQSLLSSAVATVINRQQISALFPLPQLMQHNYIIKTCLTTFTYLTTVVQNKRSAISTFETIVSVVTTESLTNLYATELMPDIKPTKTKFMEVKTIQASAANNIYQSDLPKIEKRIDEISEDLDQSNFDLIQPSEVGHAPCTSSCSCSNTKTEGLKTKYNTEINSFKKIPIKSSKYGATKLDVRPTNIDKNTQYGPYEFESGSHSTPIDKIVEKYTEVINDENSSSIEESELLTNEQAPTPIKTNQVSNNKNPEKSKPEKHQRPIKNKFDVADLLKLGTLGIKKLTQLAPVIEKMTGGFMKRQDNINKTTTTTTTVKPVTKLTQYSANKRIDSEIESKSNFPIYIPVDDMEMSESQLVFTNATLHQNLAWAAEHKHPKSHIAPSKNHHVSPLLNGGIPISPGEIITANSDVIVGKPAVGGPLTLAASGIRLQNPVNPPPLDSFVSGNEQFIVKEKPSIKEQSSIKVDDSYDLRPPELPKQKSKPNRNIPKHHEQNNAVHHINMHQYHQNKMPVRPQPTVQHLLNDNLMKTEQIKTSILANHGRPAFLDYIPSFTKPNTASSTANNIDLRPFRDTKNEAEIPDNSPSSSEMVDTRVQLNGEFITSNQQTAESMNKPFLVDIQPSRVANVLIPHGSATALVFAGSSEPHKTGDYVDDPLPYPEPGYFGSFSIDAPQMTNVHNVPPNNNKPIQIKPNVPHPMEPYTPPNKNSGGYRNDQKLKWKDNKRPVDFNKLPPPTSNQETHFHIGPQITEYNPDVYKVSGNGKFEKYHNQKYNKDGKEIIDKEYENYLAVPPPPPPKIQFSHENNQNNHFAQKPIVHQKPVQDMKVFLNIQHPVPKQQHVINEEKTPTKVKSEIYFAAQAPPNTYTPTYTVHIPNSSRPSQNNYFNQVTNNKIPSNNLNSANQADKGPIQFQTQNRRPEQSSFTIVSSPNIASKPGLVSDASDKDNTYTITLNTATNVGGNVPSNVGNSPGQIIGSSVPVSIGLNNVNANIPIKTNFAIRVEDGLSPFDKYNIPVQGNRTPPSEYDQHGQGNIEMTVGDNRWNTTAVRDSPKETKTNVDHIEYHSSTMKYSENNKPYHIDTVKHSVASSAAPSLNSHANFPMMNDFSTPTNENVKPVTEYVDDIKPDQKRPAKLIPNIPTNSHGWYSSLPINEFNSINQIKESTTRKAIPLLYEYTHDSIPDFGQKIASAGKPPTEFWAQNKPDIKEIGNPFVKPQENETPTVQTSHFTTKPLNSNYIPHNLGSIKQPVYDIPIRDNSDETTTSRIRPTSMEPKPVYEDSHEIYDGEEGTDLDVDGEVSQESMHEPVVSISNEKDSNREESKSSTEIILLKDEILDETKNKQKDKNIQLVEFDPGTQTEKPFDAESYNKTNNFHSNNIKSIYENESKPYTNMKPRPFTISTATTLDHQLHQPHWQINQLMENSTNMSYEENLELNIGEEMSTISTSKPTTSHNYPYRHQDVENKYKRPPQRPVFSLRPNVDNSSNIITSTVHLKDKKPLTVWNDTKEKSSTLPTFTISTSNFDYNKSSSDIIDLSPPPPTMDYNFKPSTNDEMIMGMSPPPPGNSVMPPARPPLPTRPPPRTPPPYRTKPHRTTHIPPRTQRPTRKPVNRDEISTYRPSYDILNNIKRPFYNHDQPSLQLLPPPRDIPSKTNSANDVPPPSAPQPNLVFPTPNSSGWLTSSGVDFSSSFDFGPTSIQFPQASSPSIIPQSSEPPSDNSFSYENEASSSTERLDDISFEKPSTELTDSVLHFEKPLTESTELIPKEGSTESNTKLQFSNEESHVSDTVPSETSREDVTTDKMKVIPLRNKNRTRKPYTSRDEEKKPTTNKYKLPARPTPTIKPTRTQTPGVVYPTRLTPSRRQPVRPVPSRPYSTIRPSIIESSEYSIDEEHIEPTEVLKDGYTAYTPAIEQPEKSVANEKTPSLESSIVDIASEVIPVVKPTHHAGNEIKISDEVMPTKTEFRTTVVTLTKTLSEPPQIISSIGYVNLTHTLTVTQTKTSLVTQSEGAATQTLVLTNTLTSTIVDVVTEIHTQVQPTTIVETVTKHIPVPQIEATPVKEVPTKTKIALDDVTMSSEEKDNFIIRDTETTENIQKIDQENEGDNESFFVVMNKSQNGGQAPPVSSDIETSDYDLTRNEQVNSNGVSQVLFGEILLAGTPYLETTNVGNPTGLGFGKECLPDCKASRNERCQRIDGIMKCVCRPGFARMFPDRPCKPTYTYSVKLALSSQGNERLTFHENLADNSTNQYHSLALATHEGINRMVMQSDLRDVYHGVHITGFHPVEVKKESEEAYQGVMNDFYVQLSDNAHESRLKEVLEKYLRNNNYSLGGTEVFAASELMDRLNVSDFDECTSGQFHDCSEHAQCFNLRGTYTCSCLEGFADLSVNPMYPGRICSAEPVGCERCNYHGACYSRDDRRVLCECFQWYAGSTCHINLKVVLISLVTVGALLTVILVICAVIACSKKRPRPPPRSIVACIQSMPGLHQGAQPKQRADRRALINERGDSGDASSVQNASLPYMPAKKQSSSKKMVISEPPAHEAPPPPAPAVMIPRARLHPPHRDSREMASRKQSLELSSASEAKLISYLESGANANNDEMMRRKHSMESSYSAPKDRHNNNKQGALVSAGFKVSTTIRPDEQNMRDDRDDMSSVNKNDLEAELRFDSLRKSYSQEDLSEWTDAERRIGELTLSEARSVGGTLPASTGRAASSTRLTHQEANTMAERDLGSTFLLPHVHLYKPDITSDVSEFDSL